MLKFWKKSENSNLNCKKSSSTAKTVNFQEEVTVFQSSAADEIKTQISIQTKATASRKFKLFSIIKWRSKKRKRKNKNSSIKRRKSKKGKKPSKGKLRRNFWQEIDKGKKGALKGIYKDKDILKLQKIAKKCGIKMQ